MADPAAVGAPPQTSAPPPAQSERTAGEGYLADQVMAETNIKFDPNTKEFHMMVDGKQVKVSALEAISLTLTNRYKKLSEVLGHKVQQMQDQLTQINEASEWAAKLGAPNAAQNMDALSEPSESLKAWMDRNNITMEKLQADPPDKKEVERSAKLFSNYVDQLSGTNDLAALSLKNATQKAEQAMSTADAILGTLHHLMEGMAQNIR